MFNYVCMYVSAKFLTWWQKDKYRLCSDPITFETLATEVLTDYGPVGSVLAY